MEDLHDSAITLKSLDLQPDMVRSEALHRVRDSLATLGYTIADVNEDKPWGGFYRIADAQADRFVSEFFPGLSPQEARLGRSDVELSPKIMIVYPGENLSWQYHFRRAERWRFLTQGAYYKSKTDVMGERNEATPDEVVQFGMGERHRLSADSENFTVVAEIWQHTDPEKPSDELDIVRLADDYQR